MKIYAISDMHGQLKGLDPKGMDLVLIAGDFARLERRGFRISMDVGPSKLR